jgi:PAS domain S-box-containing protein
MIASSMPKSLAAPLPANEPERLDALRRYGVLDTPPEHAFDDLALLASQICGTPVALVSLVDSERQWFKARVNFEKAETPRDVAFCAHAVLGKDLFVVPDASADRRFAGNPLVTGRDGIRFYAGAPLVTSDGFPIGTLCVMDRKPRRLTPDQTDALKALSRQVVDQLELRRRLRLEREEAGERLHEKEETLRVLVSQMPAVLWTTDRDLRFLESAGAGLGALGEIPGGVRGLSLFGYFRTTDPEFPPIAAHRRALAGESVTYEASWQGRTFQSHVEPLRDADGAVRGVVGVAFDVTERKAAEEALRRSVALLNATLDATADGILVVDAGGNMVHCNRRFLELWGIPEHIAAARDENRRLTFVLDKLKDPAAFVKKVMTVYAQPAAISHDLLELNDGRMIERDSLPQVVDGTTVGRVWSFRDVTERKHAEEGAEANLSLLRATLEATADGILVVDNDGRIVSFNRKFADMWHIPDDVMASRDDNQALAFVLDQLRDPERFLRKVKELYDEPDARSYDWLDFKDGRMFERYSSPQKVGGKTVGRVWSFHDVTRMRLMEDTIRRHARAFDHISDGVITMGLDARIVDWNPGAQKLFGYSKEEMLGHTPDLLRPADVKTTALELLGTMRREGRWSGEMRFQRKDATAGVVDVVVVPLFDDFGRTLAALAVCRDVTDRKNLEEYRRRESNP